MKKEDKRFQDNKTSLINRVLKVTELVSLKKLWRIYDAHKTFRLTDISKVVQE